MCNKFTNYIVFPFPHLESELRGETEAKPEDTESLSSTATSDTSSRNLRSDSLQSKAKNKPIKNPASLAQTRLVKLKIPSG